MEIKRNEPQIVEDGRESCQEHQCGSGKTEQPAADTDLWISLAWPGPDDWERVRLRDVARRG